MPLVLAICDECSIPFPDGNEIECISSTEDSGGVVEGSRK
jgi:hypothetical protein